jgi:hypothetical protein
MKNGGVPWMARSIAETNSKHEARKHETNLNFPVSNFRNIWNFELFRISDFEIRACLRALNWKGYNGWDDWNDTNRIFLDTNELISKLAKRFALCP